MTIKTFLLFFLLLMGLAGVMAAGFAGHWWRRPAMTNVPGGELAAAVEYDRIMKRFMGADSAMDVSGSIRIYDEGKGGALKEENGFQTVRYGSEYYWQLSFLQGYCDGRLVLTVDTVHRQFQVSRLPGVAGGKGATGSQLPGGDPNSTPGALLFSDTAKFRLTGTVEQHGTERELTIHSDYMPAVKVCRIFYDTSSYRLNRSEIEWWKDRSGRDTAAEKVWLSKLEYVYRPRAPRDIGKEIRSYIVIDKDRVTGVGRYAGYTVEKNF